jgi:mannitol-1-/sugar-/sorbitol-6-phosphatase
VPPDLVARALLFDMDGTLVDSTVVVERMWHEFAAHAGVDAAEVLAFAHGRRSPDTVRRFLPDDDAATAWLAHHERSELEQLDGVVAVAGAAAFLAALDGAPVALVTSAPRELAGRRMAAAGLPVPATLVGAEDVGRGKPDPEGYLRAAGLLGVPAAQCVVFEDAPAGLEAGLASGAAVVEVSDGRAPTGLVERVLRDYAGLTVARGDQVRLTSPAW